jgi:hypothetical protein
MVPKDPVKAEEYRKKLSEAAKKSQNDPDVKRRKSEGMKKYYENNPEAKESSGDVLKKYYENNPEKRKEVWDRKKGVRRPFETRQKISESLNKYYEDNLEARKRMSETTTKQFEDTDARKRSGEISKKYYEENPEAREKMSDIKKKYYEDHPEEKARLSEARKKYLGENPDAGDIYRKSIGQYYEDNPEARLKASIRTKTRFEDPKESEKLSASLKEYHREHPEKGYNHSEFMKNWFSFSERQNQSKRTKKSYIDKQWMGSVKYYDGPQYCEKWTPELRERVRAWFGHCCVECGAPQNGTKLHVHHVWYNKKLCCDDTPRSLVCLCQSCHGKTSAAKGKERDKFSIHFQEIIDTYYEGRCWMTREEMKEFKNNIG